MQHKSAIAKVFSASGYTADTIISLKQFQTVMNQLTTDNLADNQSAHSLAREIWKQTQTNKLQTIQVKQGQIPVIEITTEYLISYIVDAIEILTNRTQQCRKTIKELKSRQKQVQQKKDYPKLQVLQHKLTTLIKDNYQFENDLKVLTQPFLNENNRLTLIEQKNPRKNETLKSVESIRKQSIDKQTEIMKKKNQEKITNIAYPQFDQYMRENQNEPLDIETVEDQKKLSIWLLGLLIVLQTTVIIVKFSFLNLMVFLLALFVLLQPFRQNMTKIVYYSFMLTLPLDILWLVLYSKIYLSPDPNTGLTHIIKPYFMYIWFITIVQSSVKLLFLIVMNRYQYLELVMSQQMEQQEEIVQVRQNQRVLKKYVDDHYLPNLKEFAKIDSLRD